MQARNLDDGLARIATAKEKKRAISVAVLGNAAEILPELVRRGFRPDAVTDQTAAHDLVYGYLPIGWTVEQWRTAQSAEPDRVAAAARASIVEHVKAMLAFKAMGVPVFDYGNNLRQQAHEGRVERAFDFPSFVVAYVRPLFCRGKGPLLGRALGDPEDIYRTDRKLKELFAEDRLLARWLDLAEDHVKFQGLPARICWLGLGERHVAGLAFNDMVARGELAARSRSAATTWTRARSRARTGNRADARRLGRGGRLADPERAAHRLLRRVLGQRPQRRRGRHRLCDARRDGDRRRRLAGRGTAAGKAALERSRSGVMRHADAGYETAIETARTHGLDLPFLR